MRRRRDRVSPEAVGLRAGGRRRATGLRREELAGLAGISADYLTRLEQGRATSPSVQVVESLARALRLPDSERALLYQAAGHVLPGPELVPTRITPSVQRLLDRLEHTPVVVYDAAWTFLLANAPYEAVMGPTSGWHGHERNAVWRHLTGMGNRTVHTPEEWSRFKALMVADLRATVSRYPADPALRRLVRDLTAQSPLFGRLWEADTPVPRGEQSKRKTVEHPAVGRLNLDCDTLFVATDDLRIMIYTAEPGTEDAERLQLAIVLGTQELVGP